MRLRRIYAPFLTGLVLLAGCSQPGRQEITDVREPADPPRPAPPKASTEQRLDLASNDPMADITFHVDVPEGWEKIAETDLRQVNLRMIAAPEVECYFTLLPGGGGGLEANINRWRTQMALEPLSAEAIAALPQKALFNQPATFVDIEGTFSNMGAAPQANYRMYGLILHHTDPHGGGNQAFFLKMTGPKDVLAGQLANFEAIAASLHVVAPGDDHSHDHGDTAAAPVEDPHAAHGAAPDTAAGAPGYTWTLPEGWEALPASAMRLANVTITGQPDVECYLTELSGSGGGLEMNINRWRQQMGQPDLSAEEVAALPQKPLLGGDASFVTIDGTYGGMSQAVKKEGFRMYGLVHVDDTRAYFVKMTGPEDVLAAQEENFLAFSASIKQGGAAPAADAAAPATDAALPAGHPPVAADSQTAAAPPASGTDPTKLTWTAPDGWTDAGERMMREVTYTTGDTECYVAVLQGEAGGVTANVNRWIEQMGGAPLEEAAIASLPQIDMLGGKSPLVEATGDFTNMAGEQKTGYKLLGALVSLQSHMVFVKMTGPEAEVDAQKDKFVAFCGSLR